MKVSLVAESYSGQESVSAVARRQGLSPSQHFTWRRELRKQMEAQGLALPVVPAPLFVPAVVDHRTALGVMRMKNVRGDI